MIRTFSFLLSIAVLMAFRTSGADATSSVVPPKSDKPQTATAARYQALVEEYEAADAEANRSYQAAKTDAEREKLSFPDPVEFAPRFIALAKSDPKDPVAVEALVWVAMKCHQGKELNESLDLLRREHLSSERLGKVAHQLPYANSEQAAPWLQTVMDQSPHHDVQGEAAFALARIWKGYATDARALSDPARTKEVRGWLGDPQAHAIQARSESAWREMAEQLYEKVRDKFADVKGSRGTLAEAAQGELFELRHLGIGQVAPEIAGKDVNGKEFKLSDYRGKVVMIDFWGDW